jgi:hypothetical protein
MSNSSDFADLVLSKVDRGREFAVQVEYDPDGDCIEFLVSDEDFYAERIDALVTVYYGRESGQIIGSLVKGVSKLVKSLLERYPGFRIDIQDGRIRLEHLFTAKLWSECEQNNVAVVAYRKLRDVAEKADASAELCLA